MYSVLVILKAQQSWLEIDKTIDIRRLILILLCISKRTNI